MSFNITRRKRETLASFISRTAAAFHVDAATFATDRETSFKEVIAGSKKAIETLASFNCEVPDEVVRWSPEKVDENARVRSFRSQIFPTRALQRAEMSGCPLCLRDDLKDDENAATSMAMRGHWLVSHLKLCTKHHHPIVPLWRESNLLLRFDSAPQLARLTHDILDGKFDCDKRNPTGFEMWLDKRLKGTCDENWLDQFSLHAACNYCLMLGTSMLREITTAPSRVSEDDKWIVYEIGFKVASRGKTAIREALNRLQGLPGGPQDGPRKIFPKLYDRLAYDYIDDPDYDAFRDILRSHMRDTWPLGIGDELLGEPVTERRLHSVRTASLTYGIDQRRCRKLLVASGVVPSEGLPDAWQVFDATVGGRVLETVSTLVTAKDFAKGIGASRSQFDRLVADGVLTPRFSSVKDAGTKAIWDPADGVRFLESVFLGATPLRQAQHGWEHISKSASRLMVGPGVIIRAIQDRRIARIGNHADFEGYAALYVYHSEVCSVVTSGETAHQSIELFSKSVGVGQPSKMRRLILNGHTPATRMKHPKLKTQQLFVTQDDAATFHRRFYTLRTMAQAYGRTWQSMVASLREAGVNVFSPDGQDYGTLYERSIVDEILSQPHES